MILSRVRILPQQRYDLEDLYAQQSAGRTDAKLWTKEFLTDENSILKGFSVTGIGFNQATIVVANSTLVIPENTSDFSWFTIAPGSSNIVIPDSELVDNTRNYVEINLATETNTPVVKSFWDPSANSGVGAEFNQLIDTTFDLDIEVDVSTGGFSGSPDKLPLAIIDVDAAGLIKIILDRRDLFFKLGTPADPTEGFAWSSQIEPGYNMVLSGVAGTFTPGESITIGAVTATLVSGTTSPLVFNLPDGINFSIGDAVTGISSGATGTVISIAESFVGADKDIGNQREANRALQTEIRAIKGTDFWFEDAGTSLLENAADITAEAVARAAADVVLQNDIDTKITGVASSVDSEIVLFSSTSGKASKRATGTGFAKLNSGVLSTSSTVDAATELAGIAPVANGGTGKDTLAANNVLLGNGTAAVQEVAPGTSGNLLTSNGTTWESTAPPAAVLPAGVILPYAGASVPTGYLFCDGSAVSRATYSDLFTAIATTHGTGDGSTTFNIPDYRGRFLRGVDGSAGRDPEDSTRTAMNTGGNTGDNVGSVQSDAFQGHKHRAQVYRVTATPVDGTNVAGTSSTVSTGVNSDDIHEATDDGVNGTPRTSLETRPINAYVNYMIKY